MTTEKVKAMTDEELVLEYDEARGTMSYYNAAEGSWSSETSARNEARDYLDVVRTEMNARNLTPNKGTYLC